MHDEMVHTQLRVPYEMYNDDFFCLHSSALVPSLDQEGGIYKTIISIQPSICSESSYWNPREENLLSQQNSCVHG